MRDTPLHTRAPKMTSLEKRLMLDASLPVIAGQVLWLDADDASTIRDTDGDNAATGTGGANNGFGGTVATWVDKSASGFNVTNATSTQQPTYTTNALNGNNVITLDGVDDKLRNAGAVIAGDDYTAFIVFNRTTAAGRDAVFELGGGASRNALFLNDGGLNRLGFFANATFHNSSATYTTGTYEVVTMIHDVTAINMWRNGVNQLSTTGTTRASTTGLFIGDDSSGGDDLAGNIAEMIVYNRDLTSDERRDIENYLASKWGRTITGNSTPVIATNTGATVSQSDPVTITSAMLASTDADNTESILKYTLTDLADYGTLTNTNTSQTYILGETFTQADINAGYIRYTHNGSVNFTDSFSFTVTDQFVTTAAANFNLTITPDNQAPILQGSTLVTSENFESGATGWNNNTTETSTPFLTRFLGRRSNDGGLQSNFKTYTLSGTQDYTILSFDFYRIDSWDSEQFRIFINDTQVFNQAFTQAYDIVPDGSFGSVSWTAQEVNSAAINFAYGTFTDQITRITMRIDNSAAGSIKLGFGSTTNQATNDEAWGVDNLTIHEVKNGGVPGPFSIVEGMPNGTVLGTVTARDPDMSDTISFSITGGTGSGIFAINPATGVITLTNTAAVNFEATTSYTLIVRATDNGTPSLFDQETITINVVDRPENSAAPVLAALGPLSVAENAANNTVIGTAVATDADGHAITYSISAGNTDNIFAINAATGAIRVNSNTNLNLEWDNSYTLTIVATDNGFGNLTNSRNVVVNVTNINEAPTFNIPQSFLNQNPYLRYNATTGNFYQYVGTTVANAAAFTAASSTLLNGVAGHLATISNAAENAYVRSLGGGSLWLGGLDSVTEGQWVWGGNGPENGQVFSIGAAAQAGFYTNWIGGQPDNSGNSDFLEMQNSGQWADVNGGNRAYVIEWEGNAVLAALGNGPFTIAENPTLNQSVGFVHARDADTPDTITYSITGGTGAAHFAVNSVTGEITVSNPSAINFESATNFTLNMRIQDAGGLFSTQIVTINITDVNEAPVLAAAGPFAVNENVAIGTIITTMAATDVDGDGITYSIQAGNTANIFTIDNATGIITILNSPNFELGASYTLTIRATDDGAGTLFDSEIITININDLNEAPVLGAAGPFAVNENVAINTFVGTITATDQDSDPITYSITGGTGAAHFAVNATTGNITVSNPSAINFESATSFTLNMRAQDAGGLFSTQTVTINITDMNDIPALLVLTGDHIAENSSVGTVVGTLSSVDEDTADMHSYSFISNPGNFFMIVGNQITASSILDYEQNTSISITVRTNDGNGGTLDQNFIIQIDDVMDAVMQPSVPITESNNAQRNVVSSFGERGTQNTETLSQSGIQILRENITFKIREIIAIFETQIQNFQNNILFTQDVDIISSPLQTNEVGAANYTNLREALEFLQELEKSEKEISDSEAQAAQERAKTLPDNTINRQFVDVMTYHQDRVAHLRQALMTA